jgi:hypothetical protein
MSIFNHLRSGIERSIGLWKCILIIWFSSLLLVSLFVQPLKAGINSILGSSMITEKLNNGIDFDVFANTGTGFPAIFSVITKGFILVILTGFLVNVFYNGGLFTALGNSERGKKVSDFFRTAASNFWSFLVIEVLLLLIVVFLIMILVVLPVIIARGAGSGRAVLVTIKVAPIILLLVLPLVLLVADYSRTWQVVADKPAPFRAVGTGFRKTFGKFLQSYAVMAIVLIIQLLFVWLAFEIISGMKPVGGWGVFLLFLLSQFSFILKTGMRAWRYGSITSLFELQS